jgi:transcriptional regulator with XRE-family HTH domain
MRGDDLDKLLGEELRRARQKAGLTQEELAHRAQLDRSYVSLLENGHKTPTVDVLFRICTVSGVSASRVLARVERKKKFS